MKNQTLNELKCLACIGVVFIHIKFPGDIGNYIAALSRSAVAIFFLVSGYYLFNQDNKVVEVKLVKRIKHIALLTVLAFAFYFLWESFVRFWGGGLEKVLAWYVEELFTLESFLSLIFFSVDVVVGHLWYLVALLQAYIVLFILYKFRLSIVAYIVAIPLIITHIIVMTVVTVNGMDISMHIFRSVWFYALPFIVVGMLLKKYEKWLDQNVISILFCILLAFGVGLTLIERTLVGNLQVFFGTVFMAISSFMLAVRYPEVRHIKLLSYIGEKYSTGIYILHWFIMEIFIKLREVLNLNTIVFDWLNPIFVLLTTIVMIAFFVKLKEAVIKDRHVGKGGV